MRFPLKPLRWLEAGLLLAAAIWGLIFQLTLPGKRIPEADYQRVAAAISRDLMPGDAVLLYPWWTERARLYLPLQVPVIGYLGSDQAELVEHPRIWLLAAPELPRSDLPGFLKGFSKDRTALAFGGTSTVGMQRFGKLSLGLFENGRARKVLWRAVDHLAEASVYLEGPGGPRRPCRFDGRGFACPGGLRVDAAWHELFYQPRYCLFMHAPGGDQRLVARFDHVPHAPSLRLSAGIIWEHAWKHDERITPYRVALRDAGGKSLGELTVPVGREGLLHRDLPFEDAGDGSVQLSVQADTFQERDGCVELTALGGTP